MPPLSSVTFNTSPLSGGKKAAGTCRAAGDACFLSYVQCSKRCARGKGEGGEWGWRKREERGRDGGKNAGRQTEEGNESSKGGREGEKEPGKTKWDGREDRDSLRNPPAGPIGGRESTGDHALIC